MGDSAFLGQPTKTQDDYWIARFMLMTAGLTKADPHLGVKVNPRPPPPDQYHFETKGPGIIAGMCVAIAFMVLITGTRLAIRYWKPKLQWGWDDWLIIPGVIFAMAWPGLQIGVVQYGGGGKHIYDVTYHEYYYFKLLGTIARMFFFLAVGVVKMSITCFNMRITGLTSKRWMIAHRVFFAALLMYTLAIFFYSIFQCQPPLATYDAIAAGKLADPPKCRSTSEVGTVLSIIHVIMDFCLLTVPIIVLWKIQMHWTTKLRLYFVFSIGATSCIGSVLRQLAQAKLSADASYNYTGILTWTLVDLTFGVTAASLPVLSALIPFHVHRKGSGGRSSGFTGSSGGPQIVSHASDDGGARAQRLQRKDSLEGILREDAIELQYHPAGTPTERDRTSGLGLHANNDVVISPSPVSNYPATTFPTVAASPHRQWNSWARIRE